jgi:hypothetical protein
VPNDIFPSQPRIDTQESLFAYKNDGTLLWTSTGGRAGLLDNPWVPVVGTTYIYARHSACVFATSAGLATAVTA